MSPRKDRMPADPRHAAAKCFLERYWRQETGLSDIPWGPADAGALGQFLRANPKLRVEVIEQCLNNRLASEDHAPGERFYRWIGDLLRYNMGPLDRYRLLKRTISEATVGYMPPKPEVNNAMREHFLKIARRHKEKGQPLSDLDHRLLTEEGEL